MAYTKDTARANGAQCPSCPYYTGDIRAAAFMGPQYASQGVKSAGVAIVLDYPSPDEVKAEKQAAGWVGQELSKGLRAASVRKDACHITYATLCSPVGKKYAKVLVSLRKINAERLKKGKPLLLPPVQACRPRLLKEIKPYKHVLTLGGMAYEGVTTSKISIQSMRGAPVDWTGHSDDQLRHVMPTLHPNLFKQQLRWRHVFLKDVARFFRIRDGVYGWKEPIVTYIPTYEAIKSFLSRAERYFAIDTETDGIKPLTCNLRCVGIGTASGDEVIIIPFLSIDGHTRFYSSYDERRIVELLKEWIANPAVRKLSQNGGSYDQIVFIGQWATRQENILDTILLHRSVESEMPHGLAYIGSVYTDIPGAWKAEHTALTAKTDKDLWYYCALDVSITARVAPPLIAAVKERNQQSVVVNDHKIQQVCVGMHINGMLVDPVARDDWDRKLLKDALMYRKTLREVVQNDRFNPASVLQVRDLLFSDWQLPIINRVDDHDDTSEPSTDDDTIRALLLEPGLSPTQKRFLNALRMFRRRAKLRGMIVKLRKRSEVYTLDDLAIDEDDAEAFGSDDARIFTSKDTKKEGILDDDGRLRSSWNAHGTNTGRLSSGRPFNMQNVKIAMRNIFVPQPGCCYVYIDADQLELRLVTMFSGAQVYTQVFKDGGDPHSVSTLMVTGEEGKRLYDKAVAKYGSAKAARKEDPDWSRVCDFGKRFTYAAVYKASIETIQEVLRSAEDESEKLIYADLTIEKTQMSHRNWLNQNPEIERWWVDVVQEYRDQGYLADAVHGRRCDFADGENENQIINFRAQSTGAALINDATLKLVDRVGFERYGKGTGLVTQVHDALTVECPIAKAPRMEKFLEECMHQKIDAYPDIEFTGSAKSLKNWRGAKEDVIKW